MDFFNVFYCLYFSTLFETAPRGLFTFEKATCCSVPTKIFEVKILQPSFSTTVRSVHLKAFLFGVLNVQLCHRTATAEVSMEMSQ